MVRIERRDRHHNLGSGLLGLFVEVGGNSSAVVDNRNAVIDVNGNFDFRAVPVQGLVD